MNTAQSTKNDPSSKVAESVDADQRNDIVVKAYRSPTLQGALMLVREELGPDASVLETREVKDGTSGHKEFEVLASDELLVPSRFPNTKIANMKASIRTDSGTNAEAGFAASLENVGEPGLFLPMPANDETAEMVQPAHQEDLRSRLRRGLRESSEGWLSPLEGLTGADAISARKAVQDEIEARLSIEVEGEEAGDTEFGLPPEFGSLLMQLTAANMDPTTACDLVRAVESSYRDDDRRAPRQTLLDNLENQLVVTGPIQVVGGTQHVIALVGPTGMGKTTTVAKLSAHFKLTEHRSVGLITVDTYRVAAVDQLRTYAEIMELPLVVAYGPDDVLNAIDELSDCDVIIIDTAGCSPQDELRMEELEQLLEVAEADEVHLVAGATLSPAAMQLTTDRFSHAGAEAMILTKLDEASGLGDVLRLSRVGGLPFSYVCDGQEVPHDISAAVARDLACRIVGQPEKADRE